MPLRLWQCNDGTTFALFENGGVRRLTAPEVVLYRDELKVRTLRVKDDFKSHFAAISKTVYGV